MPEPVQILSDFNAQLVATVKWVKSYVRTQADINAKARTPVKNPTYRVIIDTAIAANTDPLGEPPGSTTTKNCTVLRRNTETNQYVQSELRLALSNESEESYAVDDAAWAVWQDGRYIVTGCPVAVSSRPTPPWDTEE